jgi:hypothetical protein
MFGAFAVAVSSAVSIPRVDSGSSGLPKAVCNLPRWLAGGRYQPLGGVDCGPEYREPLGSAFLSGGLIQ